VGASISTPLSHTVHLFEPDVVAFHVMDSLDGNSVRGDYAGSIPGVVRPLLQWTNRMSDTIPSL
jgi:lipopolysaccharide transport system ATP-binding protein